MSVVTFKDIQESEEILNYIQAADKCLESLGYTEHNLPHVSKVSKVAGDLLFDLGYAPRIVELTRIAGLMHDIGNSVNRIDHAQSGAMMSFYILNKMGMPSDEIAIIVSAIGNHDESTAFPVNPVAAALIIADKCDVRRSRVRPGNTGPDMDMHDRVNYSVIQSGTRLDKENHQFILEVNADTGISPVVDFFKAFLSRIELCYKAASVLGLKFRLFINGAEIC
ncbi:MAG: HD domain-containing protein [Bacteroidales bacterium]|nr:HD domain-containing protein [Candidatus Cryptobacteroides caccocaballi]MCQ2145662.1 HD domain-containing protein [Bacteroidales bacterium]